MKYVILYERLSRISHPPCCRARMQAIASGLPGLPFTPLASVPTHRYPSKAQEWLHTLGRAWQDAHLSLFRPQFARVSRLVSHSHPRASTPSQSIIATSDGLGFSWSRVRPTEKVRCVRLQLFSPLLPPCPRLLPCFPGCIWHHCHQHRCVHAVACAARRGDAATLHHERWSHAQPPLLHAADGVVRVSSPLPYYTSSLTWSSHAASATCPSCIWV